MLCFESAVQVSKKNYFSLNGSLLLIVMVQKMVSVENNAITDVTSKNRTLPIFNKIETSNLYTIIPTAFYDELRAFCIRNAIVLEVERSGEKRVARKICMQCFKAFMIEKAAHFNLPVYAISQLSSKVDAKVGHQNYYLDQGDVRNLDSFL